MNRQAAGLFPRRYYNHLSLVLNRRKLWQSTVHSAPAPAPDWPITPRRRIIYSFFTSDVAIATPRSAAVRLESEIYDADRAQMLPDKWGECSRKITWFNDRENTCALRWTGDPFSLRCEGGLIYLGGEFRDEWSLITVVFIIFTRPYIDDTYVNSRFVYLYQMRHHIFFLFILQVIESDNFSSKTPTRNKIRRCIDPALSLHATGRFPRSFPPTLTLPRFSQVTLASWTSCHVVWKWCPWPASGWPPPQTPTCSPSKLLQSSSSWNRYVGVRLWQGVGAYVCLSCVVFVCVCYKNCSLCEWANKRKRERVRVRVRKQGRERERW